MTETKAPYAAPAELRLSADKAQRLLSWLRDVGDQFDYAGEREFAADARRWERVVRGALTTARDGDGETG